MLKNPEVVILTNIISPYKTVLFNELYTICTTFKVLYLAKTEKNREWVIKKNELKFPYELAFDDPLDNINPLILLVKIWKRLIVLNPDVLIIGGYQYPAYWAALVWAKIHTKKIILWSASNQEDQERFFLKEKCKEIFVKSCDAANVYGSRNREYLLKFGMKAETIFVKGQSTDNAFYYNKSIEYRKQRNVLCEQLEIPFHNFIYIGRFSEEKNILQLLKAYNLFKLKQSNNWGLVLVGSGPQQNEITSFIETHNLENVFMPGFKQMMEIPKYLAISDVFILPSTSEPWGLVVNEAMAAGLPVLVSRRCGCYPDIVKEGVNGLSFDPFNVNELSSAMQAISDGHYNLENMGQASLDIIRNYTPRKASEVILDTIQFVSNSETTT